VRVEPADLPWRLVAFGDGSFENITPLMQEAPFACRAPIGRERTGVRLRLAFRQAPPRSLVEAVDHAFGLGAEALRYEDAKRGVGRRLAVKDGILQAVRLSGDTRSEPWLLDHWQRGAAVGELRSYLLLPVESPPGLPPPRGKTVCTCFDVSEDEIAAFADLKTLQEKLKCGTRCGSCLPELRSRVAA
jgi:assimilatory nitrate reductase catalytic subunit